MFNVLLNAPLFAVSPNRSATLQYADMSVISNSVCMVTFGFLINGMKICVSTPDKRSPCNV